VLTERDVRALLHTDASVERMFLNDEFDVWAVGEDLVAKFPRTEIDAAKVPVEEALHPTLRRLLGDVVPEIRLIGSMGDTDRRFIVHKRANGRQGQTIDGVTISPADGLARHLGTLFRTLHEVDVRGVCEFGIGERHLSFDLPPLSEETIATTTGIAGDAVTRFLASTPPPPSDRRTICHTDIKGEHVFVDEQRRHVTAIIDWADTEVCDPAKDYAGLASWLGPSFARTCADMSGEDDPTLADRAIWLDRAGLLDYWDAVLAGRETAPIPLITEQLRIAFSE
jgi:aminoglycoside phosphotransferase (APT) family kinase protein